MIKSPWAVLLCKFNDDSTEPFTRDYYEDLFTVSGVGTQNMVDFFRDISHGSLDLSDSRVFGWYTLNKKRSEYVGSGANPSGRNDLINWARQAATAKGDDLSRYVSVVVCMNVSTDLFGGGNGVVCDNGSTDPRYLGQEMGHFYGLDHSRAETIQPCGDDSGVDYKDFWDVMSTAGCAFSASHPRYNFIGPGLNAANMASRGWLDESRVWKTNSQSFDTVITLRPLHRRDLSGFLSARLGEYLVEFRNKDSWDAAIPKPAVLIHRFEDNHSYLMSANSGKQDLGVGDVFGRAIEVPGVFSTVSNIEVLEINANQQFAKIRLHHHGIRINYINPEEQPFRNPGVAYGVILGGVISPVSRNSPLLKTLEHIALYESSETISSVQLQNAVRLEMLSSILTLAQDQMQALQAFRQPASPQKIQECEGK
jgi:hypothetical protein